MSKINTIGIVCHPARESLPLLLKLVEWAKNSKITIKLDAKTAKKIKQPKLMASQEQMAKEADIILVLGGDGSILQTVRAFAKSKAPIAGINLGHLGFLTLDESENAISTLEQIKKGLFRIENRMMLQTRVVRGSKEVYRGIALNDVVIQKEPMLRVINIKVSVSGSAVNTYHGDGLIIATPTGSTAYSLSAGGPIVPPWVDVIILCPLNCHTLSARPVITSDKELLSARLECVHSNVDIVLDGQESFCLKNGDLIEVEKAEQVGKIAVLKPRNFFDVLRRKMSWG